MMGKRSGANFIAVSLAVVSFCLVALDVKAEEVGKGEIPVAHLDRSLKTLPWEVAIWDVEEALVALKDRKSKVLWVDTRPQRFFDDGTVRDAVLLVYDQSGAQYQAKSVLTEDSLKQAISAAGMSDNDPIAFFCQGPKCHRSYNAAFVAITEWGFSPSRIVWFRDGYPVLLEQVKQDPKLARKAHRYLSDSADLE